MKRQDVLKTIFFSLILSGFSSSCGLIEKFKTPEQPTDSKTADSTSDTVKTESTTDDLFSQSMNETKEQPLNAGTDAPSNIASTTSPTSEAPPTSDDLKSLESEFSGKPEKVAEIKQVKVEEALPEIKSDPIPAVVEKTNHDGKMMTYKLQKGETLMQVAFKIYGDISRWKDLKAMNAPALSKHPVLYANMELKYAEPEKQFVWNPEGTPYMIKTGETLGTISNTVYQTPKKWKSIWENNKPLIKNPNIIYAGFTVFYKGAAMANYVQPKANQRKVASKVEREIDDSKIVEEVKVEQAISNLEHLDSNEIDLTKEVQAATTRNMNDNVKEEMKDEVKAEVKNDEAQDEALAH